MSTTTGMKVVVSTYTLAGTLIDKDNFYIDDDTDIINSMDNVEHFLFDQYDKFLEGDGDDISIN